MTGRGAAVRVLLACALYLSIMQSYALVDRPVASGIAAAANVLFFNPGFGARAAFDTRPATRGEELTVRVEHAASGMIATNRLDLRFRVWLPTAVFLALMAVTPARPRARIVALALGLLALMGVALVASWLVAAYTVVLAPENMAGLGTAPRVAFGVVYSVMVLSNPAAAAIPLAIWGILSWRGLRQVYLDLARQ
jgi:hypothetical protein